MEVPTAEGKGQSWGFGQSLRTGKREVGGDLGSQGRLRADPFRCAPHSPRPPRRRRSTGPWCRARRLRCSAPCGCNRCSAPQRGPRPWPRRSSGSSDSSSSHSSSAATSMARRGCAENPYIGEPRNHAPWDPPLKSCPSQIVCTHLTTTAATRPHSPASITANPEPRRNKEGP